ncbi:MAG: FecR domain-containing protein [Lachnospiraceae bacterium]|nr:FecR domain-containing protein [Lachnospiraceae bacterium]MCM1238134.1 FecR domain-containing protein [Lachnospiraceae bacterium]
MDMKEKGMHKKGFIVAAAVAVVAVVALALISALGKKEDTYRSIKIIELDGSVTIEREGVGTLEASSNMNLISGDAVKTEQDAYAVLQLDSDKYVMLAESGSMTIVAEGDEANGRTAIRLDSGSVLNEIQNPLSSGSSYDIVTPNATMSVRGTVFEVRKNKDGGIGDIEVLVYDGKVAVGLGDAEPVLYEAGEYTQFTAGQNPQFIVERAEISEEHLNPQFMERLEQIGSQSRELNLGTALLASAQTQDETAESGQTPAVTGPVVTPAQTVTPATPAPSVAPVSSVTPAATPKPAKTPAPQAAVQTPEAAAPVETPVAEAPEPDHDDDDDQEPAPTIQTPQPTQDPGGNDNGRYQDFWKEYTMASYEKKVAEYQQQSVSGGNAAAVGCAVIFYVPYMVEAQDSVSTLEQKAPTYTVKQVTAGSKVEAPEIPAQNGMSVSYWCLEDGTSWDFANDVVKADTCLYPVWGDDVKGYFVPVIARSDFQFHYYCNSVLRGSYLKETAFSEGGNEKFKGWWTVDKDGNEESEWKLDSDMVVTPLSLKASWSD